jgi:hypothetical protein
VIKCTPVSGGARQRQKSGKGGAPQTTKQPRVVCVTVQRRGGAPGFKASLHVCKKASSGDAYEIRKSFRLKNVSLLEAFDTASQAYPTCQISFGKQHGMRLHRVVDSRIAFECPTKEIRAEMLGVVYSFCKSHEGIVPELVGLTRKDLGLFGEFSDEEDEDEEEINVQNSNEIIRGDKSPSDDTALKQTEEDEPCTPVPRKHAEATIRRSQTETMLHDEDTQEKKPRVPITTEGFVRRVTTLPGWREKSNKKSMETIRADILLDAISEGANSLEDACARISLELEALDDANTHELLELDDACRGITNDIFTTLGYLDDLEETVVMFTMKLTHLSDDISTIDESSSYLEHHAVNNAVLLETIDSILDICTVSPEIEHVINDHEISAKTLDRIESAYRKLHAKIEGIENNSVVETVKGINDQRVFDDFHSIRVVQDALQHMKSLETRLLKRLIDYYDSQIDAVIGSWGEFSQGSKELVQVQMHERIAMLTPVLGLIFLGDPQMAETRMLKYIDSTNTLLKKEVMEALSAMQQQQQSKDSRSSSKVGKELLVKVDSLVAMERVQSQSIQQKNKFHAPSKSFQDSFEQRQAQGDDGEAMKQIQGQDVSTIFQTLVSSLIPRIKNEISVLLDLLHKSGILMSEVSAVRSLVQGIGPLLSEFVKSIKSSRGLACLDITGSLQSCLLRLPPESPHMSVLHTMIAGVLEDCRKYWGAFRLEIEKAIKRFDSRSGTVNSLHILPFVVHFEYIAQKIEAIVAEWTAKDGTRSPPLQNAKGQKDEWGSMPGTLLRYMADELYQSILPTIFKAIEASALEHDKYKERIRLENYAFLRISLQSLPIKSSDILNEYCSASADGRSQSLKSYVAQIMSNSDLKVFLLPDACLKITQTFNSGATFEEALTRMIHKLRKDVGDTSFLVKVVWERVDAKILQSLENAEGSEFEIIEAEIRPTLAKFRSDLMHDS